MSCRRPKARWIEHAAPAVFPVVLTAWAAWMATAGGIPAAAAQHRSYNKHLRDRTDTEARNRNRRAGARNRATLDSLRDRPQGAGIESVWKTNARKRLYALESRIRQQRKAHGRQQAQLRARKQGYDKAVAMLRSNDRKLCGLLADTAPALRKLGAALKREGSALMKYAPADWYIKRGVQAVTGD